MPNKHYFRDTSPLCRINTTDGDAIPLCQINTSYGAVKWIVLNSCIVSNVSGPGFQGPRKGNKHLCIDKKVHLCWRFKQFQQSLAILWPVMLPQLCIFLVRYAVKDFLSKGNWIVITLERKPLHVRYGRKKK